MEIEPFGQSVLVCFAGSAFFHNICKGRFSVFFFKRVFQVPSVDVHEREGRNGACSFVSIHECMGHYQIVAEHTAKPGDSSESERVGAWVESGVDGAFYFSGIQNGKGIAPFLAYFSVDCHYIASGRDQKFSFEIVNGFFVFPQILVDGSIPFILADGFQPDNVPVADILLDGKVYQLVEFQSVFVDIAVDHHIQMVVEAHGSCFGHKTSVNQCITKEALLHQKEYFPGGLEGGGQSPHVGDSKGG